MNLRERLASLIYPQRENPVGHLLSQPWERVVGVGDSWAPATYGDYMAKSLPVYAAIKMRADAISRLPVKVYKQQTRAGETTKTPAPDHPLQALLDAVNPHWTAGDLWRATETYLGLWGVSYWAIESSNGIPSELWPLRPDRVRLIPDAQEYIRGYVYSGPTGKKEGFLADEIVRIRYFNPVDEYSGLSPIAPLRLSIDMGFDVLKGNREALKNASDPGLIIHTENTPTDDEVQEFYDRWEQRFKGSTNRNRPALLSEGMKAERFGFSPKEMERVQSLVWTLGDVARAYNIPLPMLHELSRATYSNYETSRRVFWEDTIVPQAIFFQQALQESLIPLFKDPTLVAEFDTSKIEALQEDETEKASRRTQYVSAGILTPNEVRTEMGLKPIAQEGADDLSLSSGQPAPFFSVDPNSPIRALPRRSLPPKEAGRELEKAFLLNLKPREVSFHKMLRGLFNEQLANMLARLAEYEEASHSREHKPTSGILFEPDEWEEKFAKAASPLMVSAMESSAKAAVTQYQLGIAFDVTQPLPKAWLDSRAKWWAGRVNHTTGDLVTKAVAKANLEGLSLAQLSDELRQVNDFNTGFRASTIARTEMVAAQGEGHLQAYQEAEIELKEWLASIDEATRESHASADGQRRPLSADFDVGGYKLRAPGQGGPAGEVINCRCVPLPVV